jgi:hypothetical protein
MAAALAEAVQNLAPSLIAYKSMTGIKEPVLDYLNALVGDDSRSPQT